MPENEKKIVCPRCGMPLADNLPKISLEIDFDKREVRDSIFCSVCRFNITKIPGAGQYGYSAMISCKHIGRPAKDAPGGL